MPSTIAVSMPEVMWPRPLPLEGVKSRKKAIFNVPSAYCKSSGSSSGVNTFSGLELTLESRIAAVGRAGFAATELLLGARQCVTGSVVRHDGLVVVQLGPQLIDLLEPTAEQYLFAAVAALEQQPQVVILEEGAAAGNKAWSQAFDSLFGCEAMRTFRGALVICVQEETPAVREVCSHRWTAAAEWMWQEDLKDDASFEIMEDVLNMPHLQNVSSCKRGEVVKEDPIMQEVVELAWNVPFNEDIIGLARKHGWTMTLLTTTRPKAGDAEGNPQSGPDSESAQPDELKCTKRLAGFICYRLPTETTTNLPIQRLAAAEGMKGCGHGRRLMHWVLDKAAQKPHSEVAWINCFSLDTAMSFYERFGFFDMTTDDLDSDEHFQTFMEMPNISMVSASDVSVAPPLAHS